MGTTEFDLLIKVIIAHFIGDFLLQPNKWVNEKENQKIQSKFLYAHIAVHLLLLIIILQFQYILLCLAIALFHYAIDLAKCYLQGNKKTIWFFLDQGLHLVSLIAIWSIFSNHTLSHNLINGYFFENKQFLCYALAVIILTKPVSILIKNIISQWDPFQSSGDNETLRNAGEYIGVIERLITFILLVKGHWEAIGFLIAAKSVFRFGELKESEDKKLTEYVLIGTLLSFGIAIAVTLFFIKLALITI